MEDRFNCESCGMPISNGKYCIHCVDNEGNLQPFKVRFEKMVQWMLKREPAISREEAESRTRAYMGKMPAWSDRPELK